MKRAVGREDLLGLAGDLATFCRKCGADEAEVSILDGDEFNVDVRMGKIENLIEAGSRVCGLRVIRDKRTAFASSSDLSPAALRRLVRNAVRRADLASPDGCAGLAPLSKAAVDIPSLRLHDPAVTELDARTKIGLALETERIALADRRIKNSYGASFVSHEARTVLANTNGFSGEYDQTYCGLSIGLQAGGTDSRVEDFWFTAKRHFAEMDSPETVAREAVARTVRQLRPRKIKTQTVPVIFERTQSAWLLGFLFSCVAGTAVYQKSTFLAGRLGRRIANSKVTVVDDGLLPGRLGTRPFDSDGVPARRTVVVEKGILKNFLCNTYAARKLKLESTGSGDGTGISPSNFYLESGKTRFRDIVASTKKGLLLTRTLGHGLNPVTGDISRGAFGLWIEDGEVAYPVSEITISGNLGRILRDVEAVADDLEFWSSVAAPTVKVAEMTVAGE